MSSPKQLQMIFRKKRVCMFQNWVSNKENLEVKSIILFELLKTSYLPIFKDTLCRYENLLKKLCRMFCTIITVYFFRYTHPKYIIHCLQTYRNNRIWTKQESKSINKQDILTKVIKYLSDWLRKKTQSSSLFLPP